MSIRELWDRGEAAMGGWCVTPSSVGAEIMARAGFDYVCVDTQHGLIGYDQLVPMLQAISVAGVPAFVRVSWNHPGEIMKALDAGAQGVIVPMVNTAEEARAAVAACRYHPEGTRSWGPTRAAMVLKGYSPETANRHVVVAVMIETATAIANLGEILAVPGIDAVYVGPNDLALSSGMKPSITVEEPEHERLVMVILDGCLKHGVVAGIHCADADGALRWKRAGYRMMTIGSDKVLLENAARAQLATLRGTAEKATAKVGY